MNWSDNHSLHLARACVWLFSGVYLLVICTAPWLFRILIRVQGENLNKLPLFLLTTYLAAVPAGGALLDLHRLLAHIGSGAVFTRDNTMLLRRLSWCCLAVGLLSLASTLYYLPFLSFGAAAGFVGVILRVLCSVFAEAVRLKDENDYTI